MKSFFFLTKFNFFAISKMTKNQFLNWGKRIKSAKYAIFTEKSDLFDFTSFCLDCFKFSGPL